MIPYNLLPIETHLAMITAELANVPVLQEAARMWTEARGWMDTAQAELRTRTGNLTPEWTDDAGRALSEKLQRSQAELQMWGERIDTSAVSANLTTLASAIPEAHAEVSGLYQAYLAAIANPLTAGAAVAIQQASGARMSALGAQFDSSMLTVCAAAGAANPAELVPGLNTSTPKVSMADLTKTATDATDALSAVQGLESSLTGGGSASDLSGLSNAVSNAGNGLTTPDLSSLTSGVGPSLAGLTGATTMPALPDGGFGIGALSGGSAPVAATSPGSVSALGGASAMSLPMMPSGRTARQSASEEVQPGNAVGAVPMGAPHAGTGGGGLAALRPGTAEGPGNQSGRGRPAAAESDGVLSALRGRSGAGEQGFTLPRTAQSGEPDPHSVELLDEELWQVRSTSTW
ncbi:hypothetical protein [Kutzneria sp. CA-103260]|uniref:hypothetical protein n=1 Tax=Kutzneria sp. CA-103260 TaxID=2802641 RepID=UPI001BAB0E1D|nr:hypothetical protein [Kutzneria sp. CA-103260]QUQ67161.1 hypothetical protein JJ691_48930 [Kutzneria sp. CA-103260]